MALGMDGQGLERGPSLMRAAPGCRARRCIKGVEHRVGTDKMTGPRRLAGLLRSKHPRCRLGANCRFRRSSGQGPKLDARRQEAKAGRRRRAASAVTSAWSRSRARSAGIWFSADLGQWSTVFGLHGKGDGDGGKAQSAPKPPSTARQSQALPWSGKCHRQRRRESPAGRRQQTMPIPPPRRKRTASGTHMAIITSAVTKRLKRLYHQVW